MSKALLLLIDGCRVDTLRAARTPAIDSLMERGAWSMDAQTVTPSVTLPVHFSIFTSLSPVSHGVVSNASGAGLSPSAGGVFQWLKAQGKTTAMYYNWEFLRELSPPGYLDRSVYLNNALEEEGDMEIARIAGTDMVAAQPDFTFVYLGCLDEVGHAQGYESLAYSRSLERADMAVGHILDCLERAGLGETYSVLLQSDHGGLDRDHTTSAPEVMTVPWILAGPDVRPGKIALAGENGKREPVSVLDSAPTLMRCMGLPCHHMWNGRVIETAFSRERQTDHVTTPLCN